MHDYRKLEVWKKAIALVKKVYISVSEFPQDEKYGLSSQMKRCAVSIPSNIAEGSGRGTDKQFIYFLNVALGSSYELETQIIISFELNLISSSKKAELIKDVNQISKMIYGLRKSYKDK